MDASICNIEYVSEKRLQQMMGDISSSTVWRYVQAGILPQPRQIGPNRKAWLRHELEQKMSEFPIANGKPVAPGCKRGRKPLVKGVASHD